MELQRIETPHNTPEQVGEYVDLALGIMVEKLPSDLHTSEVLVKVLDLIAGKSIQVVQPAPLGVQLGVPRMDIPRGGRH